MSKNYSLVVGVEHYRDAKIKPVDFAAADAKAMASALNAIGFASREQELLVNDRATQNEVRYHVRQLLGSAGPDDTVFFFFSGHGLSQGKRSFLVVEDSRADDFVNTCVPMDEILAEIGKSRSRRVALFLDCCHSGLMFPASERSVLTTMNAREIDAFFRESQYQVAFSSCRPEEKSYSSRTHGHGIWTHHLLQALTGKVPEILEKGRYLLAAGLQTYLVKEVPLSIRAAFTDRRPQNPVLVGSLDRDFLIGDLDPVLPKPELGDAALNAGLKKAEFRQSESGRVRDLPGFDKSRRHFVPDSHSSFAVSFIGQVGQEMVEKEANIWHARIQSAFNYKRRDIELNTGSDGAGIRTKDFDLSLTLEQHPDDPAKYVLTLMVDNFAPGVVHGAPFNEVFADAFSVLKLHGTGKQDIPKLIDRIEDAGLPGVKIDYPAEDPTYVTIRFDEHKARFVIGSDWMKVKLGAGSPSDFVAALRAVSALQLHGKVTMAGLLPES